MLGEREGGNGPGLAAASRSVRPSEAQKCGHAVSWPLQVHGKVTAEGVGPSVSTVEREMGAAVWGSGFP